jgi:hypothetical protein
MLQQFNVLGIILNKIEKKEKRDQYHDYYQVNVMKKPKKKFFGF